MIHKISVRRRFLAEAIETSHSSLHTGMDHNQHLVHVLHQPVAQLCCEMQGTRSGPESRGMIWKMRNQIAPMMHMGCIYQDAKEVAKL